MLESGKEDFVHKKSYEISYALWRIAANIHEKRFADELFGKSVELVGSVAEHDIGKFTAKLSAIEYIIKFGLDVGLVGLQNTEIILREIGTLKAAIADFREGAAIHPATEVDLSDIFSSEMMHPEGFPETKIELEDLEETGTEAENGNGIATGIKAEMRQSAILERIRQIGNCRLADIQAILPGVSDRTIRYDLESLVERGLVIRMGTGGRSVYYQSAVQTA